MIATNTAALPLKQAMLDRAATVEQQGCYVLEPTLKGEDPVAFEVLNSKLVQAVTSAHEVARLVSASPMTRELGEVIFGLYTPEGDAVVLSRGLLIHVHTMSRMIKWMLANDYESAPGIRSGDYFFNNDPYIGGAHCPDQMIVTPIYHEGELIAWAGGLTHTPETGSSDPGGFVPFARSRFEEGLFLPCVKIAEDDQIKRDLELLVERSVRSPIFWLTDNRAKMTGVGMIRDQVLELVTRTGVDYFRQACREYVEDSYRAARKRVTEVLAPGRYREVAWRGSVMPGLERLLHGPVELVVNGDGHLDIDFTGMSPAGHHPFQGTLPTLEGLVMNVVIQHLFYDLKHNEGVLMAARMTVPEGSAGNPPSFMYPTALWGITYGAGLAVGQALSRAFYAKGYREEVHATSALSTGYTAGGTDQYGRPFGAHNFEFAAAGLFGTAVLDGLDTAGVEFNPEGEMGDAEIWEQILPPLYLGREIHIDGGGFGKYRGGNGVFSLYMLPETASAEIGAFGSAPIFSAPGLMGGYPAGALYMWVGSRTNLRQLIDGGAPIPSGEGADPSNPDFVRMIDADWTVIKGANRLATPTRPYDVFTAMSGDGGGFGDPLERNPRLVAADLANGLTTLQTVRSVYGVQVDAETYEVDQAATDVLRRALRAERLARGVPAQQYRERVREELLHKSLPPPTARMYQDLLPFSPEFRQWFLGFWGLPDDWQPGTAPNPDHNDEGGDR